MIVADASLLVKVLVKESGSIDADREWETAGGVAAPALVFSEVGNVLSRKRRRGEIDQQQFLSAAELVRGAIDHVFDDADLISDALHHSIKMSHSVYDCLYLAAALETGLELVTADQVFVRKCYEFGFKGLVRLVGENGMLKVFGAELSDSVERLLFDLRALEASLGAYGPDPLGQLRVNRTGQSAAIIRESVAYRKLCRILEQLPLEDQAQLLALCWLGRGTTSNWNDFVSRATGLLAEGLDRHIDYVIGQLHRLPSGLQRFKDGHVDFTTLQPPGIY